MENIRGAGNPEPRGVIKKPKRRKRRSSEGKQVSQFTTGHLEKKGKVVWKRDKDGVGREGLRTIRNDKTKESAPTQKTHEEKTGGGGEIKNFYP